MESSGTGTPAEDVGSGEEDVQPSGTPDESREGVGQTDDEGTEGEAGTEEPSGDAAEGIDNGPPEPGEEPSEGVEAGDGDSE